MAVGTAAPDRVKTRPHLRHRPVHNILGVPELVELCAVCCVLQADCSNPGVRPYPVETLSRHCTDKVAAVLVEATGQAVEATGQTVEATGQAS